MPADSESPAPAPAPGAPAASDAPKTPAAATHFLFQHKVFTIPRAYFALAQDTRKATYYVPLGDIQGVLSLPQLKSGFDIAYDSPDAALLDVVEKGLAYVKRIQPGDSIPSEILNGTASWTVEDKHRMIAESRMRIQISNWMSGKETGVMDTAEIMRLASDPALRDRAPEAAGELAEQAGIGRARQTEVLFRVERLVRELTYIEALRDRFASVKMIGMKLVQLSNAYGPERGFAQEVGRVIALIKRPLGEYDRMFKMIDARTAKVVELVRDHDASVAAIRQARDGLHKRFMLWDELIPQWQELSIDSGSAAEALVRVTYRMVVRHFPQDQEWARPPGSVESRS